MAVNAFTGLMLLAQGFALAAVTIPGPASANPAAMTAAMPCHHEQAPGTPRPQCCDDGCLGMVACATAHVALMSSRFSIAASPTHLPPSADPAPALPPPRESYRLRPPIAFHA